MLIKPLTPVERNVIEEIRMMNGVMQCTHTHVSNIK